MSTASVAAAKIYIALSTDNAYYEEFACSREPYRAIVDKSREDGLHSIEDGSEDYEKCLDCLEVLICCE